MGTSPTSPPHPVGWGVLLIVAARPFFEIAWAIRLPVTGVSPTRLATVVATGALLLVVARWGRGLRGHPLTPPLVAWLGLLLVGLVRAPDPLRGLEAAVRYGSGLAVAAAGAVAWSRGHARALPGWVLGGAAVPIAVAWGLLADPDAWVQLHGVWRFVGPWRVLHAHALAMGTVAGVSGAVVLVGPRRWRGLAGVACVGASVPLVASATRTGIVLAVATALVAAAVAGRWRRTAVAVVAAGIVVAAVPLLRSRFAELGWAALGVAPEGGWPWLGTGRVAIWSRSFSAWARLPVDDVLLGTGLGGYHGFWKGKEPHSELLALLYQHGPAGPLVALWAGWVGLKGAWNRAREAPDGDDRALGAVAVGVIAATAVTSLIGSTFLVRLTLSWTFWAFVASGFVERPRKENFRR